MFSKRAVTAAAMMLSAAMTMMVSCSAPQGSAESAPASQPPPSNAAANEPPLPGMPALLDPRNIYAANRPGELSPAVAQFPTRIYVPNSGSNTVDVIDPVSFKIVEHFAVGRQPQHITPSYDLKRLWVLADLGDSVTEIDPATGKKGQTIWVKDPYNMYYTPDGQFAIVVAEREARLNFLNPSTMKMVESVKVPCRGIDHMDFAANGRFLIASCEFAASLVKVDVSTRQPVGTLALEAGGMPQDVRSSPDGSLFYVADMMANGVYVVDPYTFTRVEFIPTGKGAHGISISRDAKLMYVSNRGEGSISVVDLATRKVVTRWEIPNGGTPDMGGITPDGNTLWLSGRYSHEVYAFDTRDGHLQARIKVGKGPHGLAVFPQPGRYSLGHNGVFR
ncbi:MAG TPA: YncE family protein [Vicinamibacterales bacterium]|jgi:YVTN family beta-propeller protein|nr:YncE family protein [Vicinamibacterales bacterium]